MTFDKHQARIMADRVELHLIGQLCRANGCTSFRALCLHILALPSDGTIEGMGLDDADVMALLRAGKRRRVP